MMQHAACGERIDSGGLIAERRACLCMRLHKHQEARQCEGFQCRPDEGAQGTQHPAAVTPPPGGACTSSPPPPRRPPAYLKVARSANAYRYKHVLWCIYLQSRQATARGQQPLPV